MKDGTASRRSGPPVIIPLMVACALAFSVGLVASSLIPGLILRAEQQHELAVVRGQLARLAAQNAQLREDIQRLKDPSYLEVIARSRYNLAKPGEQLYKVIDVPAPSRPATSAPKKEDRAGWLERTWRWLAGG